MERLLWEANGSVAFTSSWVTQYRNPHSYEDDFTAEQDLYTKATKMLNVLSGWTSALGQSFPDAFVSVMMALHAAGIIGESDLALSRAWVADLDAFGYVWPKLSTPQAARSLETASVIDERRNDLLDSFASATPTALETGLTANAVSAAFCKKRASEQKRNVCFPFGIHAPGNDGDVTVMFFTSWFDYLNRMDRFYYDYIEGFIALLRRPVTHLLLGCARSTSLGRVSMAGNQSATRQKTSWGGYDAARH